VLHDRQNGDELVGVDTTEQVPDRLRKLDIGHVRRLHAGLELEQLAEQVRGRAEAARRERVLARVFLEIGDELRHRIDRDRRVDHQNVIGRADLNERREITLDSELCIGNESGDRGKRRGDREQRVAVGRLFENFGDADRHDGAGLVLHDHVPAFALRQRRGDDAGEDIGWRARRVRHDDANDI